MDPLVVVLRGLLSDADLDSETRSLTWNAVNAIAREQGVPMIRYKQFDARWKEEENQPEGNRPLHQLVKSFDSGGIVLATHEKEEPQVQKEKPSEVSKMAKRATSKALG
jgi:hypothetical protein